MSWLLDTNVLSELRKGARCDPHVARWARSVIHDEVYTSVLVVGELRRGIESIRKKDGASAIAIERWLRRIVADYGDRVLPIGERIAEEWGRMSALRTLPVVDGLLAATAQVHGLVLVTRNVKDIRATGVAHLDPFHQPLR